MTILLELFLLQETAGATLVPESISMLAGTRPGPGNSSATLLKVDHPIPRTVPHLFGNHTYCKNKVNYSKSSAKCVNSQYKGQLAAYYSDQRDPLHGQKLAHQESKDMKTWGPVINDVAYDQYLARPGMTVVAYIPPIKKWVLVHELPIGNSSSYGSNYPVYYVMADSPLEFGKEKGRPIVIGNSSVPNASPYVVWSSLGGPNGTIVVSDADRSQVYTNSYGGAIDKWEEHGTPAGAVYSRAIQIFSKYPNKLMIYGGETYDDRGKNLYTPFSATVVKLTDTLKTPANGGNKTA